MSTHPVEPEPAGSDPVAPNPSHLPVEPEFPPPIPPSQADEPNAQPPKL